jgi:hypothetical protein
MFRGLDGTSLRALLGESLHAHYEALLDANGNHGYNIPNDFYTAVSNAIDYAGDTKNMELHSPELLYLFEFYRINKIGGTVSPYVSIENHGIQIPLAITILIHDKGLTFPFINDNNE